MSQTGTKNEGQHRLSIAAAGIACIVLLAVTAALVDKLPLETRIILGAIAAVLGIASVALSIETRAASLLASRTAQVLSAGALAILVFISRVQAGDAVNAVFAIDASALPQTMTVVTAAMTLKSAAPLFILLAVVLLLLFLRLLVGASSDLMDLLVILTGLYSCVLVLMLVAAHLQGDPLNSRIYQVALKTDFSTEFRCTNFKVKDYAALFIGPEQQRALFALKRPASLELKNPVAPPPESMFVADCRYPSSS